MPNPSITHVSRQLSFSLSLNISCITASNVHRKQARPAKCLAYLSSPPVRHHGLLVSSCCCVRPQQRPFSMHQGSRYRPETPPGAVASSRHSTSLACQPPRGDQPRRLFTAVSSPPPPSSSRRIGQGASRASRIVAAPGLQLCDIKRSATRCFPPPHADNTRIMYVYLRMQRV